MTGSARSGPVSNVSVAGPVPVRAGFDHYLGLALWAGLLGVLLWMGAA